MNRIFLLLVSLLALLAGVASSAGCRFDPAGVGAQDGGGGGGADCGNGVLDDGEQCDGVELDGQTCVSLQHADGDLGCHADCTLDESGCLDLVDGWHDAAWSYRKSITLLASQVSRDLLDFPVLVSLVADADLQARARTDGRDLRFVAADGTSVLAHEIEDYDSATGTLVVWVKVPELMATEDTVLHLYYGNPDGAEQQRPAEVWAAGFSAVYHLVGDGQVQFQDSSGAGHHATANNFGSDQSMAGQVGVGQYMNGVDQYVEIPQAATQGLATFTFCLWVDTDESRTDLTYWRRQSLLGQATPGGSTDDLGITSSGGRLGMWTGLASSDDHILKDAAINDQVWHHVCVSNGSGTTTLWLDGASLATLNAGGSLNNQLFWLGGRAGELGGGDHHEGVFDELQMSSVERGQAWIETSYRNQHQPASFHEVGAEEFYLQ